MKGCPSSISDRLGGVREEIVSAIAGLASEAREAWAFIHANPETGFQEEKACATLSSMLERHGFLVERGTAGMPTAFLASSGASDAEASVGFMAEYDALPGLGHACGHSLSGTASVLAGLALASVMPERTAVKVFGTPAEEGVIPDAGGKLRVMEAGLFKGVDAVMMAHAASRDLLECTVAARAVLDIEFFGKASHAGAAPHMGRNALTAAVQTLNGMNGLYQQLSEGHRMNAIVTDGGKAVNVVPEHAAISVQLRAKTGRELEILEGKVRTCAQAGADMTGCTVRISRPSPAVTDLVSNRALLEAYQRALALSGRKAGSDLSMCISTDAGTVSYHVPSIHPFFSVGCAPDLALHSRAFAEACGQETAFQRMLEAAACLALTGFQVLADEGVREAVHHEFTSTLSGRQADHIHG